MIPQLLWIGFKLLIVYCIIEGPQPADSPSRSNRIIGVIVLTGIEVGLLVWGGFFTSGKV